MKGLSPWRGVEVTAPQVGARVFGGHEGDGEIDDLSRIDQAAKVLLVASRGHPPATQRLAKARQSTFEGFLSSLLDSLLSSFLASYLCQVFPHDLGHVFLLAALLSKRGQGLPAGSRLPAIPKYSIRRQEDCLPECGVLLAREAVDRLLEVWASRCAARPFSRSRRPERASLSRRRVLELRRLISIRK